MVIVKILLIITQHTRHTIKIIVNAILNVTMNLETTAPAITTIISSYRMTLAIFSCGHVKLSLKHIFYDYFSIRIILFYAFHSLFCICHNEVTTLIRIHDIRAVVLVSGHLPSTKVVENNNLFHAFHSPLLKVLAKTQTTLFTGQTSECITVRTVDILTIPTVRVFFFLLCKEFLCIF
nr:MAG TPA: hypothetical protein [Caudoviricetes sp.]